MSDLQSIVGDDVNIPQDAPETEQQAPEQPEQQPEAQAEPQQPETPKVVPLAALHEERNRRKELAAELARERAEREALAQRVEERLRAMQEANRPPVPAFDENPAEHLRHKLDEVAQTQQMTAQQMQAWQRQQQQAAMQQQLAQRVVAEEQQFAAEKPDYYDAVKHLHSSRIRELTALGLDEQSAAQRSAAELQEAAFVYAQQGRSPAQVAYQFALAKGYTPKQAQQAADAAQKFEAQAQGVKASKSLGTGGATRGRMTAQQLLSMSDREFAALKEDDWREVMGG